MLFHSSLAVSRMVVWSRVPNAARTSDMRLSTRLTEANRSARACAPCALCSGARSAPLRCSHCAPARAHGRAKIRRAKRPVSPLATRQAAPGCAKGGNQPAHPLRLPPSLKTRPQKATATPTPTPTPKPGKAKGRRRGRSGLTNAGAGSHIQSGTVDINDARRRPRRARPRPRHEKARPRPCKGSKKAPERQHRNARSYARRTAGAAHSGPRGREKPATTPTPRRPAVPRIHKKRPNRPPKDHRSASSPRLRSTHS